MESRIGHPTAVIDDPVIDHGAPAGPDSRSDSETGFLDVLLRLAAHKVFIAKVVLGAAILAAIVALLLPKTYTATTRIMPPQQTQSSLASAIMGQLGP